MCFGLIRVNYSRFSLGMIIWLHRSRGVQVGRRECIMMAFFLCMEQRAISFNGFRLTDGKTEAEYRHEPEACLLQYRNGNFKSQRASLVDPWMTTTCVNRRSSYMRPK